MTYQNTKLTSSNLFLIRIGLYAMLRSNVHPSLTEQIITVIDLVFQAQRDAEYDEERVFQAQREIEFI